MRYENWDAILFPRDSHVPIQEYKTACYIAHDEYGRQLPTLTCYIASLPVSTPFRLSLHSWTPKAKPSALIESRRKPNQRVVYTTSVIVDGARVFHDFYDIPSKWPQEIVHEKRSVAPPQLPQHQSSQQKRPLEFPPFRQNILMQSCWDARDNNGRIKVLLSEQLIGKSSNPTELEFGAANDIVCFLFQHAPRDILEQAGIAWPIRNPLYLPSSEFRLPTLQNPASFAMPHDSSAETRMPSPPLKHYKSPFAPPMNTEPHDRPNTAPIPQVPQMFEPGPRARGRGRPSIYDDSFAESFSDLDDISMVDTWSRRTNSKSTTGEDLLFASPPSSKSKESGHDQAKRKNVNDRTRHRPADEDKHVVVTFREDQLGRLVEAFSPPKPPRHAESYPHRYDQVRIASMQNTPQAFFPKMGGMGPHGGTRPSAAALARNTSYQSFNPHLRNISNMSPSMPEEKKGLKNPTNTNKESVSARNLSAAGGKENRNPSENTRVQTPFPYDSRIPTPHPFLHGPVWGPSNNGGGVPWEPDLEMRDPSSLFSSLARPDHRSQLPTTSANKHSPVPAPPAHGSIRSRKEGLGVESPAGTAGAAAAGTDDRNARHERSLLPPLDGGISKPLTLSLGSQDITDMLALPAAPAASGLANADSPSVSMRGGDGSMHDLHMSRNMGSSSDEHRRPHQHQHQHQQAPLQHQEFVPGHRGGMSSMERVETELFSALGEELSSFARHNQECGDEKAAAEQQQQQQQLDGGAATDGLGGEVESPLGLMKRKRQGTLGGERGRSPEAKMMRGETETELEFSVCGERGQGLDHDHDGGPL